MALITLDTDIDKAELRSRYLVAKASLENIETQMQGSPSPTQAYAAIEDMANIVGSLMKVVKNIVTK